MVSHHIDLLEGAKPVALPSYRLKHEESSLVQKEKQEMLDLGIIEQSESLWASSIISVPKSDVSVRLCTDNRKVNALTIRDQFSSPCVEDLIDRVLKDQFLTKIDMTRAY